MDKCREEFEAWLVSYCDEINYHCKNKVLLQNASGYYKMSWVDSAWMGWKASRESMKAIKLPHKLVIVDGDYDTGYSESYNECKEAITSAGYKVEE